MIIRKLKTIKNYYEANNQCKQQLINWYNETKKCEWVTPQDIKNRYPSASFLPDRYIVFNIKGNAYRLVVQVSYFKQTVFIKFLGTHAEYDKWIKNR